MTNKPSFAEFHAAAEKFMEHKAELLAHMALIGSVEFMNEMMRDPDSDLEPETEILEENAATYAYECWFHDGSLCADTDHWIGELVGLYAPELVKHL